MIFCNLSELLAKRRMNLSYVAEKTGISRTTLTALRKNSFKGIQKETLDSLCSFFDVSPDKILIYSKYDVDIAIENKPFNIDDRPLSDTRELIFIIRYENAERRCEVGCTLNFDWWNSTGKESVDINYTIEYYDPEDNPQDEELQAKNDFLKRVLSSLCEPIRADLEVKIGEKLVNDLGFGREPIWISPKLPSISNLLYG